MNKKPKSCAYRIAAGFLLVLVACLTLTTVSAWSNRNLPRADHSAQLSAVDKARLSEALQLKTTLGDKVWQGWGSENIPVIVWNRSYEFLVNYKRNIPADWTQVTDDELNGERYFRRKANEPQNFAVPVGNTWAASIATKQDTDIFLITTFQHALPTPFKQIFPYRLLIQPSETQIGGLLHETFHVYQYQIAPERIAEAESVHKLGTQYDSSTEAFNSELKKESKVLVEALDTKTRDEKIKLLQQFLAMRDARRKDHSLSADFIDYERWIEWEEGTARYVEVAILKRAGMTSDYRPLIELKDDPDFQEYRKVSQRWSQELFQLRYQTVVGETEFYATGMAQAFLLDDLMPNWKEKYWKDDIFLEDLLRETIAEN